MIQAPTTLKIRYLRDMASKGVTFDDRAEELLKIF